MTQSCPHCGVLNRDTAQFCTRCGKQLSLAHVPLHPGQALKGGTYTVVRRLGKGGMGAVYLAAQTIAGQQRNVVVKEMLDYFDPNDPVEAAKARQRFEDEAATLVTLSHTGIPTIYDYFTEGRRNYIVMEYIAGADLLQGLTHEDENDNLVPGRSYSVEQVLQWGIELCKVLEYLERQSPPVVHHDVKPANVIVDANSGTPRLVDFGTAKARLVAAPGGRVGIQESSVYSTAGYAAPEMYRQVSSPRSDVYSLAATLYHLLMDDDPQDHPFNFPRLAQLPPDVAQALTWALTDDAAQRPTASQLRARLEQIVAPAGATRPFTLQSGDVAHMLRELVPGGTWALVALVVLLLIGGGVGWSLWQQGREPLAALLATPAPTATPTSTLTTMPTWMPTATAIPTARPTQSPTSTPTATSRPPTATSTLTPAATPTRTPTPTSPPQPIVTFWDGFNGSGLDTSKWNLDTGTGDVVVSGGVLRMASSGRRYPYVYSRYDFFPSEGNFQMIFRFRYSEVKVCGVGVIMTGYLVPVGLTQDEAANRQKEAEAHGVQAGVWQDQTNGVQLWFRSGADRVDVPISGPNTNWNEMTIRCVGNRYTLYFNGHPAYTSLETPYYPQGIWIGNPAELAADCQWSTLEIDYIKVESLP